MPRAKISRKSTVVDMTAMCDVAFLLLSFFILVARPKPPGALNVITPTSVSSITNPEKNVVLITMDRDAKVYFSVSEANVAEKKAIITAIDAAKSLHLTDAEMKNFYANPTAYIGVPFGYLKPLLDKDAEQLKTLNMQGIPCKDSTDNELIEWVRAAVDAFRGTHMNLMVKGDQAAKYPAFQGVMIAFKKNEQFKFQLVTDPVQPPPGTDLARERGL
jgi:biopolymer transport protein ExbD